MAKEKDLNQLFTVILTNYNCEHYLEESLSSIYEQTYNNIELIITDDGSNNIDREKIKKIVLNNKTSNIKNVKFIFNGKNIGTVKTLNKALKIAEGDYIIFFASDDKLASKDVLKKYSYLFQNSEYNIITSQWVICDNNLNIVKKYVVSKEAKEYNKNLSKQYFNMCLVNKYGAGSTCYRRNVFKKYGLFDEKYKVLEDWPFWLRLISKGETIYFEDFDGLLHRSGGISNSIDVLKSKKNFYYDILNLYKYDIMPNIKMFSIFKKIKILRSYDNFILDYSKYIDVSKYQNDFNKYLSLSFILKIVYFIYRYSPHVFESIKVLLKYNTVVPLTVVFTLLIDFFVINNLDFSSHLMLLLYIFNYYISYCVTFIFYNLFRILKGR